MSEWLPKAIAAAGPAAREAWELFVSRWEGRPGGHVYCQTARRFLRWLETAGVPLAQVTPATVEAFLHPLDITHGSKSLYRTVLRHLFAALAARGVVPDNPAQHAKLAAEGPADLCRVPTRDELKGFVRELALEPIEEGDEDFDAALVMLAGLSLGTAKLMPLSRLTAVPPRRVAAFARELRASGVWTADGKTAAAWLDEEYGQLEFWLDVLVAQGLLERVPAEGAAHE